MDGSMGNRVRVYIGVVLAAIVVVNLVVLLYVGPEMASTDVGQRVQPPKDWEVQPDVPEEPEIIPGFESDPVGDEPK